jgi:uncharacterized membrane protein
MPFQLDDQPPEIVAPIDGAELMWAAASYVFWPILPPVMLLTARREQPYLRFHFVQSILFGLATSVGFVIFTAVLAWFYRSIGTPESIWVGAMLAGLFIGWLVGLLFCFTLFMVFAWRAGRGDVFRILIIGSMVEGWVLAGIRRSQS